jgi:hypothetical protein
VPQQTAQIFSFFAGQNRSAFRLLQMGQSILSGVRRAKINNPDYVKRAPRATGRTTAFVD